MSTTEPCLLCAGAILMSLRGRVLVSYAAEDPIAGGIAVAPLSPQGRRRDLQVRQLDRREFVTFAEALNLAESIRRLPAGTVVDFYRKRRPHLYECALELESALRPFVFTDTPFEGAVDTINRVLRSHPSASEAPFAG